VISERAPSLARQQATGESRIVAFGSDYGLCGQFNDDVVEYALAHLDRLGIAPRDRVIAAVGTRVGATLRGRGHTPCCEFAVPGSVTGIERAVRELLVAIDEWRSDQGVGRVLLAYHEHGSAADSRLRTAQLLPVELSRFRRVAESAWPSRRLPTFSMAPGRLLSALLRQFFSVSLFSAFAESAASEPAVSASSVPCASPRPGACHRELASPLRTTSTSAVLECPVSSPARSSDPAWLPRLSSRRGAEPRLRLLSLLTGMTHAFSWA